MSPSRSLRFARPLLQTVVVALFMLVAALFMLVGSGEAQAKPFTISTTCTNYI